MWDRHYWHVAHQSFREQRRAQRQAFRAARRAYRHSHYRRGPGRFIGVLFVILIIAAVTHSDIVPLILLAIVGGFIFMLLRRSMYRSGGSFGSDSNYQQPNQYYQPPQQPNQYYQPPQQPNQYYQPPTSPQPNTPYTRPYQPYEQGYQAPRNEYQQGAQPYQSNPSQSASEQYEEPQAQYPQEMPPMV